jgi:hypothetical protein
VWIDSYLFECLVWIAELVVTLDVPMAHLVFCSSVAVLPSSDEHDPLTSVRALLGSMFVYVCLLHFRLKL